MRGLSLGLIIVPFTMSPRPRFSLLLFVVCCFCLSLAGCVDYCRGNGYNVSVRHEGDRPVQLAVKLPDGTMIRPDSLQPGGTYSFDDGPDGAMEIGFVFAGGGDTVLVQRVSGCGIWGVVVDSLERAEGQYVLPE